METFLGFALFFSILTNGAAYNSGFADGERYEKIQKAFKYKEAYELGYRDSAMDIRHEFLKMGVKYMDDGEMKLSD